MRLQITRLGLEHALKMRQAAVQITGFDKRLAEDKLGHGKGRVFFCRLPGVVERGGVVALKLESPGAHGMGGGIAR